MADAGDDSPRQSEMQLADATRRRSFRAVPRIWTSWFGWRLRQTEASATAPASGSAERLVLQICLVRPSRLEDQRLLALLTPPAESTAGTDRLFQRPLKRSRRTLLEGAGATLILAVDGQVPASETLDRMRERMGAGIGLVSDLDDDLGRNRKQGAHLFRRTALQALLRAHPAVTDWTVFLSIARNTLRIRSPVPADDAVAALPDPPAGDCWIVLPQQMPGSDFWRDLGRLVNRYRETGHRPLLVRLGAGYEPPASDLAANRVEVLSLAPSATAIAEAILDRQPSLLQLTCPAAAVDEAVDGLAITVLRVDLGTPSAESERVLNEPGRLAGLIRMRRNPVAVAISGGLGNMVQCSPAIRLLSEQLGQPVDVILQEDYPGCDALFRGSGHVADVRATNEVDGRAPYAIVFAFDRFYRFQKSFNADRVVYARRLASTEEFEGLNEARHHLLCLERGLGIRSGIADHHAYFVGAWRRATPGGRRIGLHAGCKPGIWRSKRWPYFEALASRLAACGYEIVSFGGPDEHVAGTIDATGSDLSATIDGIRGCRHFIANDSGLMHIADALGVPLTTIFAPTSVVKNGPLAETSEVVALEKSCAPCQFRPGALAECGCIAEIPVDRVLAAVIAALSRTEIGPIMPARQKHD